MPGHGVRLAGDGGLVLARCAPPEDPERLRRTIDRLRASAGAGAVEIVEVSTEEDAIELVLAYAGRSPSGPMRAEELAPIATALASHLSDLHLRGIAHGALVPEHVLVDASGIVRLCGFGAGCGASTSDDVLSFGVLLRALLDADDRSVTGEVLRSHADRCLVDDAAARPTMAAIAASLAGLDTGKRSIAPQPTMLHTRRWPLAVAAAIVVVALVLVALPRGSRALVRQDAIRVTTTTSVATSTTVVRPKRVWPTTLEGDGSTWTLGDRDDRTAVADLDCDGDRTPVLLQQPGGAVWVLDDWRDGAAARFLTTVPGAVDLTVERVGDCDTLVVRTADGEVRPALSA